MKAFIMSIAAVVVMIMVALACDILPISPFLSYISWSGFSEYLPYVNYFVPVDFFIASGEAWLVALTAYIGLKFARKAIQTCSDIMPLS